MFIRLKKHFFSLFFSISLLVAFFSPIKSQAIEAIYVGLKTGYVSLTSAASTYQNTIGFGLDLGLRVSPIVSVLFDMNTSSHSGGVDGMTIYSQQVGVRINLFRFDAFEFSLEGGPGFHFFKVAGSTESNFGISFGGGVDIAASDAIRIGLGSKYHSLFGIKNGDNYWQIMLRGGYVFEL